LAQVSHAQGWRTRLEPGGGTLYETISPISTEPKNAIIVKPKIDEKNK